ncbi:MAG TPA: hypothetical protein DEQ14_01735 [Treponema sp.]|nr:hypothetical protein [Treponema sp.]
MADRRSPLAGGDVSGIHAADCMRENVWKVSPLSINIGKKMQLFGEFSVIITTGAFFRENFTTGDV